MNVVFSKDFQEEFKKIKDKTTRLRIIKEFRKIEADPEAGKPLKYDLKNHRSLRVTPYRIIYRIEGDTIIVNCFDHRKEVYD